MKRFPPLEVQLRIVIYLLNRKGIGQLEAYESYALSR